MRWAALGVDFEMFGKDHRPTRRSMTRSAAILGGRPPEHYVYELFLDENGEKISKSKGNGITIDEWLTYAPTESLALYMFQKPRTAKRLYFDVIPKAVDEYFHFPQAPIQRQDAAEARTIRPGISTPASRRLATCRCRSPCCSTWSAPSNAHDKDVLWGFISRYAPGVTAETHPKLDELVGYAIRYFDDFVKPAKSFRAPDDVEREALAKLVTAFDALPADADGAAIQDAALDVARSFERYQDPSKTGPDGGPAVTGDWFQMLYQVLLGQDRGPRFGSFVALYGISETVALINKALAGELALEQA
jgi:lysyl-tRNA synthetase class 1